MMVIRQLLLGHYEVKKCVKTPNVAPIKQTEAGGVISPIVWDLSPAEEKHLEKHVSLVPLEPEHLSVLLS